MSTDVTAAVIERLQTVLPADVTVYDGTIAGTPTPRYVVVYGDIGTATAQAIDAVSRDATFSVQVTSVVIDQPTDACRWLSRSVRDALADWRSSSDDVAAPGVFAHLVHRRPVVDESVPDRHVLFAVDQFSMSGVRF